MENNEFNSPPGKDTEGTTIEPASVPKSSSILDSLDENKHDDGGQTPFAQLSALAKKYDLASTFAKLQIGNHKVWETLRNIDESYRSRHIEASGEVKEKAMELVLELSTPTIELSEFYSPGPLDAATALKKNHKYKTLPEPDNHGKNEPIYQYAEGVYIRAEQHLKTDAHEEYMKEWQEMWQDVQDEIEYLNSQGEKIDPKFPALKCRLETAIHRGPSAYEKSEVAEIIRHTTFIDPASMNPHSHIPFRNGLLNLETFKLEPFDPEKFFTYRVEANYLDRHVDLKDNPLFAGYIKSVFHQFDIPMILQHLG